MEIYLVIILLIHSNRVPQKRPILSQATFLTDRNTTKNQTLLNWSLALVKTFVNAISFKLHNIDNP